MSLNQIRQSYSHERYQEIHLARPLTSVASTNLASAAGTVLGTWSPPIEFGSVLLITLGAYFAAAGGAQTVAGTMGLYIQTGGTGAFVQLVDVSSNPFVVSSVANHLAYASVTQNLNYYDLSTSYLQNPPTYAVLNAGDVMQWQVVTQGTGAGDQTVLPYVSYVLNPNSQS